jgi:nucleoside-diphosphate-sugar epimerase
MQTILGSGGSIGIELARYLTAYTTDIRLVSRNPKKVNETDHLFAADLTNKEQIFRSIEGSEICYVTIGFDYKTKVWQEKWPPFMQAVIDSCAAHHTKLVFFDNIYAIDPNHVGQITEASPINPTSKKGQVRAAVDRMILEAVEKGKINVIIARAPDFFGPIKEKSMLLNLVYDNFAKGKAAQWFCNADVVHSFGYTPDLSKGTAMLGNDASAYNQIWNLPVDPALLTGREWASLIANKMGVKDSIQVLPAWAIKLLGLFIPILKEMPEMLYQYDRPYFFDSAKFNRHYQYTPTKNEEAIQLVLEALKH